MAGPRAQDLTGQKFGLVTVESRAENVDQYPAWNVVCECGQRRVARGDVLRRTPPRTHVTCRRERWEERNAGLRC